MLVVCSQFLLLLFCRIQYSSHNLSVPVSILSRIWGKRPQFLFAVAINVVGVVIAITSFSRNSFAVLRAGRLIQGLSTSAFESVIFSVIVDL